MIFAGAMIALIGIVAIVVDVSWYWANSLKVQRAADAAALAGAIYLPGSTTNAYAYALVEAKKDGYVPGSGTTITPLQDTANGGTDPRQLDVTISTPVQTFFARVLGITTFTATQDGQGDLRPAGPDGQPRELLRRLLPDHAVRCQLRQHDGGARRERRWDAHIKGLLGRVPDVRRPAQRRRCIHAVE